jgi:hypothetical protein
MSFSKTVSVVAALASIFAAGTAGWKLADTQVPLTPLSPLDQKIIELEKKLEEVAVKEPQVVPPPISLPAPIVQAVTPTILPPPSVTPTPPVLPPVTELPVK